MRKKYQKTRRNCAQFFTIIFSRPPVVIITLCKYTVLNIRWSLSGVALWGVSLGVAVVVLWGVLSTRGLYTWCIAQLQPFVYGRKLFLIAEGVGGANNAHSATDWCVMCVENQLLMQFDPPIHGVATKCAHVDVVLIDSTCIWGYTTMRHSLHNKNNKNIFFLCFFLGQNTQRQKHLYSSHHIKLPQ